MLNTNVMLHAQKFEQLIQRRGRDVEWQKASLCSCWNMDSGQPTYSCLVCGGKGFIYADPIVGRVVLSSIQQQRDFQEMAGVFDLGDAVMTVPKRRWDTASNGAFLSTYTDVPLFLIGVNDLVSITDDERQYSEILVKGEPLYGRPADTLLNEKVTRIVQVQKSNPDTGVLTNYTENVDFTLTGTTITWVPGGVAPSEGEKYSVAYYHRPVFTVLNTLPKPRHQDGQDMPRYVSLRYRAGGFEPK